MAVSRPDRRAILSGEGEATRSALAIEVHYPDVDAVSSLLSYATVIPPRETRGA